MKSKIQAQKVDESAICCNYCRIQKSVKISLWIPNPDKDIFKNFPPIRLPIHPPPTHGKEGKQGSPTTTYVNKLLRDTGLENIRDLESFMSDQDLRGQFSSRHLLSVDTKFIRSK